MVDTGMLITGYQILVNSFGTSASYTKGAKSGLSVRSGLSHRCIASRSDHSVKDWTAS
jgi:hypothetical protein